jgi:hypothetical protein
MLSKWEIGGGLAILFLATRNAKAAVAQKASSADASLITRANSPDALAWLGPIETALNLPDDVAQAVVRWIGIESGGHGAGDPRGVSSQGERGLAQITRTSALTEGALTLSEWNSLVDKNTGGDEQVRIAWKVIQWSYMRATKYIKVPPAHDEIAQIWYAKLYHQRPVDVRDAELTGEAKSDAFRLEMEWAGDATKLHYLHAANVVAWNSLTPPHAPTLTASK